MNSLASSISARSFFAMLLLSGAAFAVEKTNEGANGIKVGDGRLHPSLALEGRYDSLAVVGSFSGGSAGDVIVHVVPGLRLELPSDSVALDLNVKGDYNDYTGAVANTTGLSFFGLQGDMTADFNRRGKFAFQLGDRIVRSDRTNSLAFGVGVLSTYNDAHARATMRPGGGAIEFGLAYDFAFENFDTRFGASPAASEVSNSNYLNNSGELDFRWRFLPKTALVADLSYGVRTYLTEASNVGSSPIRVMAGFAGLITPRVSLSLKGGYGYSNLTSGTNFNSPIGQAEVGYSFSELTTAHLGYVRSFESVPSAFGFYSDDRVYADLTAQFMTKLMTTLYAGYDYLNFGGQQFDTNLGVTASLDYAVGSWFKVGAGYGLTNRGSNKGGSGYNYTRHEVFVRTTATY